MAGVKKASKRPKVMFLGLRGVGAVQGGVETHVTQLARHLPYDRKDIVVIGRAPYQPKDGAADPTLPRTVWLPAFRNQHAEAIVHSLLGVLYAAVKRPRVLHIHAIGPSVVTPLARLLGLKVVATHHGQDYQREKWGLMARLVLKFGERQAVRGANACIAISPVEAARLELDYARRVSFIPNGVPVLPRHAPGPTLARFGLTAGRYILNVARLVPEKRHLDLIDAFAQAATPDLRLVLVGGADHENDYVQAVKARAAEVPGVILAGKIMGDPLFELYSNAGLFALPSSHEGLPIVLLEAMEYGLPVLVADLPVYRELGVSEDAIAPVGATAQMARRIDAVFAAETPRRADWSSPLTAYRWPRIAQQTAQIYDRLTRREL